MEGIEPSDIRKWTSIIEKAQGINLAQGNCFIEPAPYFDRLADAAREAMDTGKSKTSYNTYSPTAGVPALREAIAKKSLEFNRVMVDPDPLSGTLVVTAGATGALHCTLHSLMDPGDEVILFEPFYNYHLKAVLMLGGVPKVVPLRRPDWHFDPDELRAAITSRTRAVIVNTPNNPTGKIFTNEELLAIGRICLEHDIPMISDEVYEFITFDGKEHVSPASIEEIASNVVTISAFSKTLAITGWRIGYAIAPPEIARRIRIANEMNYVCAPTPLQHAVADLTNDWPLFLELKGRFQSKREILCNALSGMGFVPTFPDGAYYVLTNCECLGLPNAVAINEHLIETHKIAGVPGSAFFANDPNSQYVRFCFAVTDRELASL
ncbi:MAG: pyridoxal phosphate-dependent aminotransferase [Chthonomonas sp.]|nr:pyridoxal phosphate-dependent aminotransferase [Chthonomonas sp.]